MKDFSAPFFENRIILNACVMWLISSFGKNTKGRAYHEIGRWKQRKSPFYIDTHNATTSCLVETPNLLFRFLRYAGPVNSTHPG